VLEDRNQKI
jgi:kinesin family member 2/24